MSEKITQLMRLMALTDSAFPVGTFSFSNGLETAADTGLVHDAATLEAYTREIARQAAFTDGVAALHARRSYLREDFDGIVGADHQAMLCKLNAEARQMTCRMGKKLAELYTHTTPDPTAARWLHAIDAGSTPGSYPAAQGIVFAACGIGERELFCSHQYGAINTVLNAALRCVRVSHYDTQRILFRLSTETAGLYDEASQMEYDDMYAFAPQIDILASLHEKGTKRLFMN
ncbi:MAG: urease accessory protein UreF [Alistipes sp.]|nr:urease accessory protein UreF [Alistipes senegalensis]MCM1251107.1 urease accessory protein UreF [Alistipes sp.]